MSTTKERLTYEQILDSPADKVSDDVVRNFIDPWSMQHDMEAALIALYVIVLVAVLIRVYAQLRLARRLIAEDYALLLAWVRLSDALLDSGGIHSFHRSYTREL